MTNEQFIKEAQRAYREYKRIVVRFKAKKRHGVSLARQSIIYDQKQG